MRALASERRRPGRGRGEGVAGTMEGVLYKWTNYLSGECGVRPGPGPLSERPAGGVGTRLRGVGATAPPWTVGTCAEREYFPKAVLS